MMPLDLCLDSYGTAVHVMDSLLASGLYLRIRSDVDEAVQTDDVDDFDQVVRGAVAAMPFEQAQALWLVDVCGCGYDQAAQEVLTTRTVLGERVAQGRRFIRSCLEAPRIGDTH